MGERWALAALFRTFHPRLLRYLASREPTVAEDLAGEVWLGVAHLLPNFVGDERAFRCWLFTIARNRLAEHRRRAARRKTEPRPVESFHWRGEIGLTSDPAVSVIDRLAAQEAVNALIDGLSPGQSEVVLLRIVAGLDVDEVAHILKRSPGSVRVLQHRALKRLEARLSGAVLTE